MWFAGPPAPGPGPLAWTVRLGVLHAALLAPSLGAIRPRWSAFSGALALPFVATASWGHPPRAILEALVFLGSAVACGAAGAHRRPPAYLPSIVSLFVLPYGLAYLAEEFGRPDAASTIRAFSPWALELSFGVFLLWAWPLAALLRRRG